MSEVARQMVHTKAMSGTGEHPTIVRGQSEEVSDAAPAKDDPEAALHLDAGPEEAGRDTLSQALEALLDRMSGLEALFDRLTAAQHSATPEVAVTENPTPPTEDRRASSESPPLGRWSVDDALRRRMISELAYARSARRGFRGGNPEQDWQDAELDVDQLLGMLFEGPD